MIIIFYCLLWRSLNVFQQAHYEISFLSWAIRKHPVRYLGIIASFILGLVNHHFLLLGIIYALCPFIKYKKKLVLTKRVWRLIITTSLIMVPFIFNYYAMMFFLIFLDFILVLANYINKPIEKIIYQKIYRKTKTKLDEYQGIKIAIGGSYGKTSTKHFLYEAISKTKTALMTEKSYNTPMGIALSVKSLNGLHDFFICEMGASKKNDIDELMSLVDPDIVILTSIGNQHLKTFKTKEILANEKRKMFELLDENKIAFVNANAIIDYEIKTKAKIITYGENGDYYIKKKNDKYFVVYYHDVFIGEYQTKLQGLHNYENILAVIAICDFLDIKIDISNISNIDKRLKVKNYETYTLIDDSFNSNIKGALNAISYLKEAQEAYVITPGLVELGDDSPKMHSILACQIMDNNIIPIVVKGGDSFYLKDEFQKANYPFLEAKTFKEAFSLFLHKHNKGATLLLLNDLPDNYSR